MGSLKKALEKLYSGKQLRVGEGRLIAKRYFGNPRIRGSHNIYSLPWEGSLLNIQSDKTNKMKKYQQEQLKKAVERVEKERNNESK